MEIYTLDTNVIVPFKNYPENNPWFDGFWKRVKNMLVSMQIIFPRFIYNEMKKRKHYFVDLIDEKNNVVEPDKIQQQYVTQIVNKFKGWIDPQKTTNRPDTWLIALALQKELTVVTNESFDLSRLKIPKVCDHYKIRCITGIDFVNEINPLMPKKKK